MVLAEPPTRPVYRPRGTIRTLWASRAREVLVAGPAGTGKSRGALEKLDNCARHFAGMRGLITRKLRTTMTQAALATFNNKVLPEGAADSWFHHGDQEYRYPNGSVIAVAGLDDAEKVKSSDYDMVYVQEATELVEDDWSMLIRGLRNGVMPYQQIMADCNPGPPDHWLKQRCDLGECLLIESQHTDNPALWDEATEQWTLAGAAYIEGLDSLTGYLKKRLRYGLWVAAEGMFFTEWNPERHVVDSFDPPPDWTRWTCTDYGFAVPWATYWLARSPERRIYVYRELYRTGLRDEEQADLIATKSLGERIVRHIGDPSMFNKRGEQDKPSIASVYKQHGVRLEPGVNARIPGWQTFRRALAGDTPRLQVMRERCPNLIRTIPTMVCDPLDPEDLADKINGVRTEDDAADALRYGLMAEQGINAARDLATMAGVPLPIVRQSNTEPYHDPKLEMFRR